VAFNFLKRVFDESIFFIINYTISHNYYSHTFNKEIVTISMKIRILNIKIGVNKGSFCFIWSSSSFRAIFDCSSWTLVSKLLEFSSSCFSFF